MLKDQEVIDAAISALDTFSQPISSTLPKTVRQCSKHGIGRVKSRCPMCVREYNQRRGRETDIELRKLIGTVCACCKSGTKLQLDHIQPVNGLSSRDAKKEAIENPKAFQMLCQNCNRWKDNGPCCPCPYWDETYDNWR